MSAKASGVDARAGGGARDAKPRAHNDGSAGRTYTTEQKTAVVRIKRCAPTAFYEILGLEAVRTTASEAEIKKAYRKLSLLTHPDKNGCDGADEAFKMVSRAFQILSDPDKKSKYDKFGGDPDSRFSAASAAGASPFRNFTRTPGAAGGRRQQMWEEEISPEELFRQFFGGGMGSPFGGGMFETGPGFVFNLGGGPGYRVHQFGGQQPRRRPTETRTQGAEPAPTLASALTSLLPLLLFLVLPYLLSLLGGDGGGGSQAKGPSVVFEGPHPPFTQMRLSSGLRISYWANPAEVDGYTSRKWRDLDKTAENRYVHILNVECERENIKQTTLMRDAQGWFFPDEGKLAEARSMEKPNCRKLSALGYRVS